MPKIVDNQRARVAGAQHHGGQDSGPPQQHYREDENQVVVVETKMTHDIRCYGSGTQRKPAAGGRADQAAGHCADQEMGYRADQAARHRERPSDETPCDTKAAPPAWVSRR